ncbi:hypothetical protein [Methylobacterium crusticola]|uniref:hypothetical protein n=1 Tax=Methylobacterium crusticola TaxID=1697972 RepID=UPI000FFBB65C|nr:hypothetical protein [Methylobacterium crusticola]
MTSGPVRRPSESWDDAASGATDIGAGVPAREPGSPKAGGGGDSPPAGPSPAERRLAAKRWNEGVKVFAAWTNALSAAALAAAWIAPAVKGLDSFIQEYRPVWVFVGLGLHMAGQAVVRFEMRSEE